MVGMSMDESNARQAYLVLVTLSVTVLLFNILITDATVTDYNLPSIKDQYGFSLTLFLSFFIDFFGNFPHGREVTIANYLNENLIRFPTTNIHISCFFFTFSFREIINLPNLLKKEGFSDNDVNFPNDDLRRTSVSSSLRGFMIDLIPLDLWYIVTYNSNRFFADGEHTTKKFLSFHLQANHRSINLNKLSQNSLSPARFW